MLAAALAAGAIGATAVPATAQTVRHHDATHDVTRSIGDDMGNAQFVPRRHEGDITWVRATYRHDSLYLSMRFRDLAMVHRKQTHGFVIDTDTGLEHDALVTSGAKYPRGNAVLTTRRGGYLPCPIRHRVSYRYNIVSVTVPARCLHNPRWVKVAYLEYQQTWNFDPSAATYQDSGYGSGRILDFDTMFGPKVHRG